MSEEFDLPEDVSDDGGTPTTVLLLGVTRIPTSPPPERRCNGSVSGGGGGDIQQQQQVVPNHCLSNHLKRHHQQREQRRRNNGSLGSPPTQPTSTAARPLSPWQLGYTRLLEGDTTSASSPSPPSARVAIRDRQYETSGVDDLGDIGGATTNVMDRSVDSIGACSLDVDASMGNLAAADHSEKSSVATLRSVSLLTTPSTHPKPTSPTIQSPHVQITGTKHGSNVRLPSYLSLACTVNGYSTTTNYDPERLLSRSRDPSPHRITADEPPNTYSTLNNLLSPPNLVPLPQAKTMNNNVNQIYTKTSATYIAKDVSNSFVTNMFGTDNRTNFNRTNVYERENGYPTKQLIEDYGESKSFIQQRVERLYGPGALAQGFFVTKRRQNRSYNDRDTNNTGIIDDLHSKSCTEDSESRPMKQSVSSPALPVLRHLRPEFRAQLPALSPRKTVPANVVVVLEGNVEELVQQMQKSSTLPMLKESSAQKPVVNGHDRNVDEVDECVVVKTVNGVEDAKDSVKNHTDGARAAMLDDEATVKDGRYFIGVLQKEADRLLSLAEAAEELLETEADLTEDTTGVIRSTSGKARLLVSQKMQQFRGLCTNNLSQKAGEAYPTTNEDLQGFWDMVMLQVNQVDDLFKQLYQLKANNWDEEKLVLSKPSVTSNRKVLNRKLNGNTASNSVAAGEARKQRDMERKRIIEERRKAAREHKPEQQSVEIFVPESS